MFQQQGCQPNLGVFPDGTFAHVIDNALRVAAKQLQALVGHTAHEFAVVQLQD